MKQEMMQQSVKVERSGLLWQWLALFIACDRLAISRADPYTTKSPLQTKDDDGKESSNTMVTIIVMIIKMIINVRIIMIIKISACDFPPPALIALLLILIMMMIVLIEIFDFLHLSLITLQSTGGQC